MTALPSKADKPAVSRTSVERQLRTLPVSRDLLNLDRDLGDRALKNVERLERTHKRFEEATTQRTLTV